MQKRQEIEDPNSCLNKAMDEELIFVLLSRDPAAAATVRFWVDLRLKMGLNTRHDQKIQNAEELASRMDVQRTEREKTRKENEP